MQMFYSWIPPKKLSVSIAKRKKKNQVQKQKNDLKTFTNYLFFVKERNQSLKSDILVSLIDVLFM